MTLEWTKYWAGRTKFVKASAIRELLKLTARPEVISFAGGLPATETLPIAAIAEACKEIFATQADKALQYGPTEGYTALREHMAGTYSKRGVPAVADNILITTGSQQGLDMVGRSIIDHGDKIVTEAPTYIGALQAWRPCAPHFHSVPVDPNGMQVEAVQHLRGVKMVYVLPNFQNPSGVSLSLERRRQIVEMAHARDFLILEDDPYRALRYSGEDLPALVEIEAEMLGERWDTAGRVIHLGTFSKIMAPGLRVGWILAPSTAIRMFTLAKQGADLHSSTLTQYIADTLLRNGMIEANYPLLVSIYRERRDTMLTALTHHMSGFGTWTEPAGGLFIWLTLPGIDTRKLLEQAIQQNVAFVPGDNFYIDGQGTDSMRLNFSCMPPDRIAEGVRRLGVIVAAHHAEYKASVTPA